MLRSLKDIEGYQVSARDGESGRVSYFLLETSVGSFAIWLSRLAVVHSSWTDQFHLALTAKKINDSPNLTRQKIKDSPEWNAETAVNREYETRLYDYYGRPADWTPGGFAESAPPELRQAIAGSDVTWVRVGDES